jgi:Fe-S-cluster containining protein
MMPEYECDCCGACCRGTLIVEAYYLDALREPRIIEADVTGRKVTLDDLDDEFRCVLLAAGLPCRFLGNDGRCVIYPTRPNTCVGFEAGDEQCQEARSQVGLPRLESSRTAQSPALNPPPVS